ncbi:MAG: GLPGLI family protein [Spirosomataceae bacterium]
MKKLILLFVVAFTSVAWAQDKSGVINYTQTVKLQIRLEGVDEAMLQNMPKTQSSKMNLFFTGTESVYRAPEEETGDVENTDGNVRMVFRRPQNVFYRNYETQKKTDLRDFAGKKFLVEGELPKMPWKIGEETKTLLGYTCQKATFAETDGRKRNIVAWFTDAIPNAMGPDSYGGLPGTILEVDINNGENVITAQKVEFRPLKSEEIKLPSGGKKVTDAEFKKIVDDYMKENGGQGGNFQRVIIRN